jgi:putative ABC transport system permease protein
MTLRVAVWLALRFVDTVAVLVPQAQRAEWTREWAAEISHRSAHLRRSPRPHWSTHMDLLRRALGSLPDAAWLRRQFTLDADAVHDTVHGLRVLRRAPAFAAVALVIFAVGIGATVAMLSVADTAFLRSMPVQQPDRVMMLWQVDRERGEGRLDVAPANARDWIARLRAFESVALVEPYTLNVVFPGHEPEYVNAARVGERFFETLGVAVLHGRGFLPTEYRRGGARVVVLSHGLWKERFGGDPAIIGRPVQLDEGPPYSVVGVTPPGLELRLFDDRARRSEPRAWLPKPGIETFEVDQRSRGYFNVVGRLRPGATRDQAQADLDLVSAQLADAWPRTNQKVGGEVVPLRVHLVGSLRELLPLLLGAAAILLAVACANVANLVLARGAARGRELAIRQALGANRRRLVRQMLVETLLLAAGGGALGLFVARIALDVIGRLRPPDVALLDRVPIDARSAIIASAVTIAAAIIAGLTPALQLSRASVANVLKDGRGTARRVLRGAFVVAEIAAALVLAVGAGLLVRSYVLIQSVNPGFQPEDVTAVQVFTSSRLDTPGKRAAFFDEALSRLRVLPGVVSVGAVSSLPFGHARVIARTPLAITGRTLTPGDESMIDAVTVAGDYFRTVGVTLLKGRVFDERDTAGAKQVALISRRAASHFWREADPVGSRVRFRFNAVDYDAEVVGVVDDVRHEALDRPTSAEVFVPNAQCGFRGLSLVVRAAPGSIVSVDALKAQIRAMDSRQPIYHAATLEQLMSRTLTGRRFNLFLVGGFALATLLLAAAGVYGLVSYSTSLRMREFGVRLALGAQRRDIVRLVVADGLKLAAIGVLLGVVLALPLTNLLRALLFGITATDPVTFVAVGAMLLLVAVAACYVPTSRALKVDPASVLRIE